MNIQLQDMQAAAILADNGPLGRHARQQMSYQLGKQKLSAGTLVRFTDADNDEVCVIKVKV